ncbi:MAG: hypothetical protein B7Z60_08975 [Ferrovum sp. 37-45-19]|jgi:hypothetical protein|uniref:hypothetical protein n=1 Tax=Ferrovum sp. JA12 TaxID=1356299 RepID=UPI0007035547|nr:hypothetical protein [Ferrovum sp. JA12]OYV78716.1 MAG: hypothetical protein B7Z65_09180 [Ferrovum sp. 21-44-67]OYV93364.1 MAG: hypothetical protein B7Z60_08975 [Ferrovum sp. 37-45-19]OZB32118.1 MAG: hypothetical protein B7X47_07425 [Ferrovum sp. 34-44-207]HQT82275.1 hypothetical protein [Ferrovaceae bacterium]KRH79104.1 hypothetical protein FERRO_01660 [Ferrovum sp. JA12]
MDYDDNPISPNEFDHDLHALNREIVRLAYILKIDLTNPAQTDRLLSDDTLYQSKDSLSKELLTLKGLLLLRGELRKERMESGLPDGESPIDEEVFKQLAPKKE